MNAYPAEHTKAMLDYWMDGIVPGAEVVAASRPGGAKVLVNAVRTAKAKAVVERPPRRDPVADLRPAEAVRPPGAGDNASSAKPTRRSLVETTARLDLLLASSARRRLEEAAREHDVSIGEVVARLALGGLTAAAGAPSLYDGVVAAVQRTASPVGAAALAQRLGVPVPVAQRLLALAASRGEVVRLTRGLYSGKGPGTVVADPVERTFANLSRSAQQAAHQRYQSRTIVAASGRSVTVGPSAIQARLARKAGGGRRA